MKRLNIGDLQHYMFTKEHIMNLITEQPVVTKKERVTNTKKPIRTEKHTNFILPKGSDTLFWCYYIIVYGQFSYETIMDNSFEEEKAIKIKIAEHLKDNKGLLKEKKWKKSSIETELVIDKIISLQTFFYMCTIRKLNIILLSNRMLYILENDSKGSFEIIHHDPDKGYMIYGGDSEAKKSLIDKYMTTYWIVEDINKPIAAISSYKVGTLREICKKLNLPTSTVEGKKLNKKELYARISCKI